MPRKIRELVRDLKNLDGISTGKKVRTVCLSTLNWQSTFRFQVQTVTTPRTMKKKMLAERSKTRGKPSDRYPLFVSSSEEDRHSLVTVQCSLWEVCATTRIG